MSSRSYEIVLLGATGYTGIYAAESIAKYLPTDLRWAIAGRSENKLKSLLQDSIKPAAADRKDPDILTCTLNPKDLDELTKKTKVLINAIGPYHLYSEPVVKACAENGTSYIDCTGETPWVRDMLLKYDDIAKKNGAIIIPQSGFESAVSDLIIYSLVSKLKSSLHAGAKDAVASLHKLNSRVISGGTLTTALTLFEAYPLREIQKSFSPWSLAEQPGKPYARPGIWSLLTGVKDIPGLGLQTTSITGKTNATIVERSASLLDYGREFRFEELMRPSGTISGILAHWTVVLAGLLVLLPPVRWLLKKVVYGPGQGPARIDNSKDNVEYRAIAQSDKDGKKVTARLTYKGGNMYTFTGILLAIGAEVLARSEQGTKAEERKGFCTPAMLGDRFIDGLAKAGVSVESEVVQ